MSLRNLSMPAVKTRIIRKLAISIMALSDDESLGSVTSATTRIKSLVDDETLALSYRNHYMSCLGSSR